MMDDIFESVRESAFGLSMKSTWQHLSVALERVGWEGKEPEIVFFSMLEKFADDRFIRFARGGSIVKKSPLETVKELRKMWPRDPDRDDLDGYGLWFFACPIDLVWVAANGTEAWT